MSYTKDSSRWLVVRTFQSDSSATNRGAPSIYQSKALKVVRTRTGDSLPSWKQRIAAHENATTSLGGTFETFEWNRSEGHVICKDPSTPNNLPVEKHHWGDIAADFISKPVFMPFSSKAEARASAEFLSAVRKTSQKLSGPTFLGELRETYHMLRKPAAALWDGIERYEAALRRANRVNRRRYFTKDKPTYARNLSQIASGLWLEHSFGWVPFLHDVDDARSAYNSLFDEPRIEHISAGGHDAKDVGGPSLSNAVNKTLWFNYKTMDVHHETIRYRGAVKAQAATTAQDRLARYGFHPSEFIPTAWELLPWSFLIDYFTNIGDILNSAATDTTNVAWVSKSRITRVVRKLDISLDIPRNQAAYAAFHPLDVNGSTGTAKWSVSTLTRGSSGVPTTPSLYFTYPTSPKRLANVAALLKQVGISTHDQRVTPRNYRL